MRWISILSILQLIIIQLIPSESFGAEDPKRGAIREFYRSVRAMGMGNAYMASVKDCEALYINPAALGRVRRAKAEIINPAIGVNRQIADLSTEVTDILKSNSAMNAYIKSQVFLPQYGLAQLTPTLCFRGSAFGVFEIAEFDALISDRSNPALDIYVRNDYGFAGGYSISLFSGRLKLGVTGKYIVRSTIDKTVYANEFASDYDLQATKDGQAIAINGSVLFTLPIKGLPRLTAMVEDVGDTYFTKKNKSTIGKTVEGPPDPIRQKLHLGFGITPKITQLTNLNINVEIRDALRDTDDYFRLVHFGFELQLPSLIGVRAGFNQGYLSYGVTLDFKYSKIEFASFGQELGARAGQHEDTRYMLKYMLGF